jgi:hypothetical protein
VPEPSIRFRLPSRSTRFDDSQAAALTFVTNAVAAKLFLRENLDRRRWFAIIFVCCGILVIT